jgi:hypothetical protein
MDEAAAVTYIVTVPAIGRNMDDAANGADAGS